MYYVEKTKGINFIKQFDYLLFAAVFILSLIGIIVLKSAIGTTSLSTVWLKQVICLVIGLILAFIISTMDYKDFKTLGIILYLASISLLGLVLVIGKEVHGSKSWLELPVIGRFQPSELAKVAFIVIIPVFLERIRELFSF